MVRGVSVPRHQKDLEDVYRSEKTRGTKRQKTPESIEDERLQEEIVSVLLSGTCTRNRFISILQRYELPADRLRQYLEKFDLWSRQAR